METSRNQERSTAAREKLYAQEKIEMQNRNGNAKDVTACEANTQSESQSSLVKYKLRYIDKKSSITRTYLGSIWYNKPCINALLKPKQDCIPCANQLLKVL